VDRVKRYKLHGFLPLFSLSSKDHAMWNPDTWPQFGGMHQSGKVCPVTVIAYTRHARHQNWAQIVKQKMEKSWMPTLIP
jgi:hypothetical protein